MKQLLKNWKNTLRWLDYYLNLKIKKNVPNKLTDISEIIRTLLIMFSYIFKRFFLS